MKNIAWLGMTGFLLVGVSPVWGAEKQPMTSKTYSIHNGLTMHTFRLENGLQVVVVPNPFAPVFTYRTYYAVGAKDERTGKRGIAHLFEHMMFRETENLKNGEFDRLIKLWGGTGVNAYTSGDETVYLQSLPVTFFEDIVRLESERMSKLIISKERLNEERGAVLGELRMYQNQPNRSFFQTLNEMVYLAHPYRYEVIGTEEEIRGFSVEDCLKFYRTFYAPNNATIVVVGDVDPQKVVSVVDKYYGKFTPKTISRAGMPVEPVQKTQKTKHMTHPYASQEEMGVGMKVSHVNEDDLPYYLMLEMLLGEQPFSMAYQNLVQRGMATSVGSHFDLNPVGHPSTFYFFATMADGVTHDQMQRATLALLRTFRALLLRQEKLEMAANQVKLHYYVESNESLASFIVAGLNYNGRPEYVFDFFYERFLKVRLDPKRLLTLAQSVLVPSRMNFLFMSPQPHPSAAHVQTPQKKTKG